jgi:hypothetical protein
MPSVDHCVLPTADLGVARERLEALGFTVAPEGLHPFGTANACVYLQDDTFLEALTVTDPARADAAIASNNVFVARDRMFRERSGEEGFSALVLTSREADADHRRFVDAKISAGPRLDFSRAYRDASGAERTLSFRLAFAAPSDEGCFFFGCERVNAPSGGRGELARHRNGVLGLAEVVVCATKPTRYAAFLSSFAGAEAAEDRTGVSIATGNARIVLTTPGHAAGRFGMEMPDAGNDLRFSGLVFAATDLRTVEATLSESAVGFHRAGRHVVVPAEPGQGAFLAFREAA